jgi:hypothetical protein
LRSIWIIGCRELQRINEDEDQIAKQEQHQLEEEQKTRRDEFGRPETPEPIGWETHLAGDEDRRSIFFGHQRTVLEAYNVFEKTRVGGGTLAHRKRRTLLPRIPFPPKVPSFESLVKSQATLPPPIQPTATEQPESIKPALTSPNRSRKC